MAAKDNLDILIIGGSGFVSGTMARVALAQGHEVWTITRGQRPVPDGVHSIVADRHDQEGFAQAVTDAGKHWDLVIDCICFEAPEARQADRPKVEMGTFFDLGNEKATAAAKKYLSGTNPYPCRSMSLI